MEHFVEAAKTFFTDIVFKSIPKVIIALLVLFLGLKLIKLLNKVLNKAYHQHEVEPSLQQFLNSLIDAVLKVLLFLTVAGIVGVKMTSFVAIVGAAGLAIGMALQGTLQNFAGGVIILLLKPFKVGDFVEQGTYAGFVENIQIFNTTLRTYDNRLIIVPNTELATKSLTNHFKMPARRVQIDVGIAYGESVDKARKVLLDLVKDDPEILKEPKIPMVTVESLGESAVEMRLYVWVLPENYWQVFYRLNQQVYETFLRESIKIPFNQMDVHIQKD